MPELQVGTTIVDRDRGNFSKIHVINMFAEQVPTEPSISMQSRSGLENTGTVVGSGPIHSLFQVDGVLSGELYAVSGSNFYKNTTNLGTVANAGTNLFFIDGFENRVFVTGGTTLYEYDGTTFSSLATPGGFDVLSMCIGSDRLIVIDKGTGHFYWSDVLSDTIDAVSFATAENSPDKLKDCLFLGDTLLLFGSETVEQWPASSASPDLPFVPLVGRTYQIGIKNTGCATLFSNSFAWVTSNNQICVGDPNTVISTPSIDEKIGASASVRLWRFLIDGTQFLALTLDDSTYVFSASSSSWSEFQSYGKTNWIPKCYTKGVFGSSIDGHLIQWSADYSDFGDVLERRLTAGMPIPSGTVPITNVMLRANVGQTTYLSGTYADPTIEIRTSKDGGFTWGNWRQKSLGANAEYRKPLIWRSLGFFSYPSFLMEIRVTDPVPFRLSGAYVNEVYAGI